MEEIEEFCAIHNIWVNYEVISGTPKSGIITAKKNGKILKRSWINVAEDYYEFREFLNDLTKIY